MSISLCTKDRRKSQGFPLEQCALGGHAPRSADVDPKGAGTSTRREVYEWADAAAQHSAPPAQFQLPSNRATPVDPNVPDFKKIRLISYDYARYGASAERKRLIARWEKEVNALPK